VENSAHKLEVSPGVYTLLGKRNLQILGAIDDAIEGVEEYRPKIYDSLTGEKRPAGRAKNEEEARKDAKWDESGLGGDTTDLLSGDIAVGTR
jgi:hypothetical protein